MNQDPEQIVRDSIDTSAMISRIIWDTAQAGLIKQEDPENTLCKFVIYIPIWV